MDYEIKKVTSIILAFSLTFALIVSAEAQTNLSRFNELRDRIKASKESSARSAFTSAHNVRHRHPYQESNQAKFDYVRDQIKAQKEAAARQGFAKQGGKHRDHKGNKIAKASRRRGPHFS